MELIGLALAWAKGGIRIEFHGFRWQRSSHYFQRRNRGRMGTHWPPISTAAVGGSPGTISGERRQFSAAFSGLLRTPGGRRLPADLPSRCESRCRPEAGQTARVSVANSEAILKTANRRTDSRPEYPGDFGTQIAFLQAGTLIPLRQGQRNERTRRQIVLRIRMHWDTSVGLSLIVHRHPAMSRSNAHQYVKSGLNEMVIGCQGRFDCALAHHGE